MMVERGRRPRHGPVDERLTVAAHDLLEHRFGEVDHDKALNVSADDHHNEDHAARHAEGADDEITPADIGAAEDDHDHTTLLHTERSADYTFALVDLGTAVHLTGAADRTFTIPPVSTVAWPDGGVIFPVQAGDGTLTITPGTGVTLNGPIGVSGSRWIVGKYGVAVIRHLGSDVWFISGDID